MKRLAQAWVRCWPLHCWALMGLVAWGWFSLAWIVLWEVGGVLLMVRDAAAALTAAKTREPA